MLAVLCTLVQRLLLPDSTPSRRELLRGSQPAQRVSANSAAMMRIDAHHHLWRYTAEEYGWIDDEMRALRRDFLLDDLKPLMKSAGVAGTVAVQARQTIEETRWLLELAAGDSLVLGVCGWLPLAAEDFPSLLEPFLCEAALKGLRHVVQAEAADFLDGEAFNRGIRTLRGTGLAYDILIYAYQLEEATRFVDRHPEQIFIVDHIAKPEIRAGEIAQWTHAIAELAKRLNVCCKLSGMVTEADPARWTVAQLKPYFDGVLEAFGPHRLLVGTDWPVLTVGCGYAQWWQVVEQWIAPLSADEQAKILGGTAARVYRLQVPSAQAAEATL